MKRAFPPVALSANPVSPPALVIMVALPAVLAPRKKVRLVADDKSRCVGRIVDDAGAGDADWCEEG
jgi:hypothetical protein